MATGLKTIKLLQSHTHAGRDYPAGAILTMEADSADWLIAIGVAELAPKSATRQPRVSAAGQYTDIP